jgi:AcrR family transcriptional regulator
MNTRKPLPYSAALGSYGNGGVWFSEDAFTYHGSVMSALLDRNKRAQVRKARREKRRAILEAASHMFARQPYEELDLDAIGRRAGVSRGIASLHFNTKEELFLELLKGELAVWFDAMEELIQASPPKDGEALAKILAEDLRGRGKLTRLMTLLHNVLEKSVEILPAHDFMHWMRDRTISLGQILERRCGGFGPGDGAPFLRRLAVVVVGIRQTSNLSGVFAAILQDDDMSGLHADFESELHELIRKMTP